MYFYSGPEESELEMWYSWECYREAADTQLCGSDRFRTRYRAIDVRNKRERRSYHCRKRRGEWRNKHISCFPLEYFPWENTKRAKFLLVSCFYCWLTITAIDNCSPERANSPKHTGDPI